MSLIEENLLPISLILLITTIVFLVYVLESPCPWVTDSATCLKKIGKTAINKIFPTMGGKREGPPYATGSGSVGQDCSENRECASHNCHIMPGNMIGLCAAPKKAGGYYMGGTKYPPFDTGSQKLNDSCSENRECASHNCHIMPGNPTGLCAAPKKAGGYRRRGFGGEKEDIDQIWAKLQNHEDRLNDCNCLLQ